MIFERRTFRRLEGAPRLFVLSFLMLFTELALIRWSGASIVYLRFFTNFVLLASFLGIGVGFLRARAPVDRFRWAPAALCLLVVFIALFPVQQGRSGDVVQLRGLFGTFALPAWIALPAIFALVAASMACIGEGVARTFATFEPLQAYRLDIAGSILGVVGFTGLSFLGARPVAWGLVIAIAMLATLDRPIGLWAWVFVVGLVAVLGLGSVSPKDHWSPYYKVSAIDQGGGHIALRVNGLPHQSMEPISQLVREQPFYLAPYRHVPSNPLHNVLIIGAGSGNDVAIALTQGADHVDAVEIDPVLQGLGRSLHPDHPYQDPRVTAIVNDGRAFLERTDTTYDLIEFALPDSLTLVSGQGSLRLESYLFTKESFESVRDHLAPGGAFSMYNFYRPDVFDRYAATLTDVFGHAPCLDTGLPGDGPRRQEVLTIGTRPQDVSCTAVWHETGTSPTEATDDHPFPYLSGRSIPLFYLLTLGLILLASLVVVRVASGGSLSQMRAYADLFCMGAAFLLLETKNVVQFALLFGTTWLVNSLVFAGILVSVFLAVEVTRRVRLPRPLLLYLALAVSLVVAWTVPPARLLDLDLVPRFLAATAIGFAPVFCANLIFAQRFKDVASSTVAFGANLLGAIVGGVLEYGALVVGYRNLLVLVALLYATAFVLESRGRRGAPGSSSEGVPSPAYTPGR